MIESMLKKGKGSVRQLHQGQQNPNVSGARPAGGVRAGCFRSGSPALLPRPRSLGCLPSPLSAGFQWVPPVGGARGRKQSRRQEQTKKRAGGLYGPELAVCPPGLGRKRSLLRRAPSLLVFPNHAHTLQTAPLHGGFYTPELHRVSKSSVSFWDQD